MNNKLNLHKYITVLRDTNCSERNSVIQLINNCIILMKALTFFFLNVYVQITFPILTKIKLQQPCILL